MCGINGFNWTDEQAIQSMNQATIHRGPDDQGTQVSEEVSLGNLRLSILDLSDAGHQPMFYHRDHGASSQKHHPDRMDRSPYSIVFNGEIYNFSDLKQRLKKQGFQFTTETDTEVILAAYDAWGQECVTKFTGMWAFVIHDHQRGILFGSRDRFGKKPFYYYEDDGRFVFSSEIKGILQHDFVPRKANYKLISDYLYFNLYKHTNETFFEGIYILEPSTSLFYDLNQNELETDRYYKLKREVDNKTLDESVEELDGLLEDSVRDRMVSDVPVAISLSGGVDSSTMSGYLNALGESDNMNAFTTSFESKHATDETGKVHQILQQYPEFQLNEVDLEPEMFLDHLKDFVWHQEEPVGLSSLFVRYMIAQEVRDNGLKVLMTGEGADEIFAGYGGVFPVHLASKLKSGGVSAYLRNFQAARDLTDPTTLLMESLFLLLPTPLKSLYLRYQARKVSKKGVKISPYPRTKAETFEFNTLNDYLYQRIFRGSMALLLDFNDKMGMANSIESRSPFVDYRILEFGFRMSEDKKIRDGYRKYVLRRVGERYVPDDIIWDREKEAFSSPVGDSTRSNRYRAIVSEAFQSPRSQAIIDSSRVLDACEDGSTGQQLSSQFILKSLFLELWFRQFNVS